MPGPTSYHCWKRWIPGQQIKLLYNTLTAFSSLSQKSYSEGCDMKCWQGRAHLKNFQTLTSVCIFLVILLVFPVHRKTGCFKIYLVVTIPHFKCMFQLAWFCFSKLDLWFVGEKNPDYLGFQCMLGFMLHLAFNKGNLISP